MLKMKTLTTEYKKGAPCVILLGGFDGLHAGHKALLERAKSFRLPVGIITILGGKTGESLFTQEERENAFFHAGADFILPFSFEEIKDIPAEEFVEKLCKEYLVKAFLCGDDFRFGKGALGTPEIIKRHTQVCVEVLPLVMMSGEKVSSSQIKTLLKQGDIQTANSLLKEEFFLIGEVVKDRQIGRTLGFPTANILYPKGKFTMQKGVYQTRAVIDGKEYKGITNYGARPTFENDSVITETYFHGYNGDLYGKKLKISFVKRLRDIQKFESVDVLKKQLEEDIRGVIEND